MGDWVSCSYRLTAEVVKSFAAANGATNDLHLDDGAAEATRFEGRVVHGAAIVAGLVSVALARFPGLAIDLSQMLSFVSLLGVGEASIAAAEGKERLGGGRVPLAVVVVRGDGEVAVEGEAVVPIEEPPVADRG